MADFSRIEDLRRRVQRDPASIAFAQLAEEYRRGGQYAESVDACRAGLVLHPGYLSARVTLGRALLELGALDEAQQELELVLRSAPENLAAIRGVAEIHHRRGDLPKALEQFKAALALAPNDPDLEETVKDLTRKLGQTHGPNPSDGLTLEQMQGIFAAHVPPAPVNPVPETPVLPAPASEPLVVAAPEAVAVSLVAAVVAPAAVTAAAAAAPEEREAFAAADVSELQSAEPATVEPATVEHATVEPATVEHATAEPAGNPASGDESATPAPLEHAGSLATDEKHPADATDSGPGEDVELPPTEATRPDLLTLTHLETFLAATYAVRSERRS